MAEYRQILQTRPGSSDHMRYIFPGGQRLQSSSISFRLATVRVRSPHLLLLAPPTSGSSRTLLAA